MKVMWPDMHVMCWKGCDDMGDIILAKAFFMICICSVSKRLKVA